MTLHRRTCRCGRRKYTKHTSCYVCRAVERQQEALAEDISEDEIEARYLAHRRMQAYARRTKNDLTRMDRQ